jgi:hypothetical protein
MHYLLRFARLLTLGAVVLPAAWTHPAIGIVMDTTGAVYYSDTAQVWRIAADGTKSVVVPNVHTHELWLDREGNLYGVHEAGGDGWTHRIWKRTPDGQVKDVIPTRKGFLEDYKDFSLARDRHDAMYWFVRGPTAGVFKREPGGPVKQVAKVSMEEPGWMSVLPDGTVILADHASLIRVTPGGTVQRMPAVLSEKSERYSIMAVWADKAQNIYAAVYGSSAVKRLNPAGEVITVAQSPAPWQPTGGLVAPDGALWILETSPANVQRVRRVAASGTSRVF